MTLPARRIRAVLLGLVLPAALLPLLARSGVPWAGLVPWAALLLVPAFGLLLWIGRLGPLLRWMEEALRRTVALWTAEPGALWLAWAARCPDLPRARRWIERAAELGHGGAAAWLARGYATGDGVAVDEDEAARWQMRATAEPLPRPSLLARLRDPSLSTGGELAVDQAHHALTEAFEAIFADPLLRRGFLFLAVALLGAPLLVVMGVLVVGWAASPVFFIPIPVCLLLAWTWRDRRMRLSRETRRLWQEAEAGGVEALYRVGLAFERGDGDHPQDPTAARAWHQRAAEAGHAEAAYRLGELFAWGQGGLRDQEAARRWLTRAADQGHGGARARLAELDLHAADADR